jgi:hypothetical protein
VFARMTALQALDVDVVVFWGTMLLCVIALLL